MHHQHVNVNGLMAPMRFRRAPILLVLLLVATFGSAAIATAQSSRTPSSAATGSAVEDSTHGVAEGSAQDGTPPVSLDHIRRGLNRPAQELLLRQVEIPPDFRIQILEQQRIDNLVSKLDFKSGPVPAGGLYAYEQQRRLFDPVKYPLMQPYAAYSGGEFATVALENLIAHYLVPKIGHALDAQGEREAQAEVAHAIADYCASRPDRSDIRICNR
jgi:hypothetical protein